MADATDLKSVVRKGVRVRLPPSAPFNINGLGVVGLTTTDYPFLVWTEPLD
jgi:hypothetical protein